MLSLAWKNVLFRKMRALLTILGVASSISLVVIMSGIMAGTEKNFISSFAQMAGEIRIQPKSDVLNGMSTDFTPKGLFLNGEAVDKIMTTAAGYDAENSSPVLYQTLIQNPSPNQPDLVALNGVLPGKEDVALRGVAIAAGAGRLTGDYDVILGDLALSQLSHRDGRQYSVGDKIVLLDGSGEFTIKGIAAKRDPFTNALAVVPLQTAQAVLQRQGNVNFVVLRYPVDKVEAAAETLKGRLADYQIITAEAMLESVNKALAAQRSFFQMINGTVYFTAVAIIFMVMYTSVMERTREIGTMRAVGAPRWAVVGGIITEAVIFTLIGAVLSAIPGYFLIVDGWDFLKFPDYVAVAVKTIGAALLIALISCLYPAIRAARINPLEALRYE